MNKEEAKCKKCPECGSTDWDWANIGFTDAVQCTDCGYIYFDKPSYSLGPNPLDKFPTIWSKT